MIQSRCGILCNECDYKNQCDGCLNIQKPFWGDSCPLKRCCEEKGLEHCGQCDVFPCDTLVAFAHDKKQGDNGRRIEQLRCWLKKEE